ncbi:hypothetical protein EMIHUDRAFT_225435 [Emiliania huxleyi CCMP1516]|uniref:RRM domain-containing protein n=2 Tax=Emiliania huxleyi TaxID=2903 RepID=A0A0D3KP64_EMIH1|nr:hypothetical protein EMIHUDRAFT_225435 [Emiliania huxleyi CCMP1516]EOD37549.1 hypothetical protein EMIHUDRAFT_225435 [Emiliania huxleyi CCMP1516]|eukprot:XP_005789978.1 hypothetical protein EMIHUDRAFT_225435 [Emiliania huxleyi CCMP1516]
MLPTMYFYSVRVPALHELLLRVEASQPVLLTASTEGLVSLVSSSPRLLAEGFPGTPAELLMRSTESEHTVHVGITLLSPPDGFEISAALEEAPVPPPQDISELAMELEATGVLDGLTSSERASIIQQVHAEEVALGHLSLPQLAPQLRAEMQRGERLPSLSFSRHEEDGGGLFGVNSLLLLAIVLLVAGSVLLATLHFMVKVDNEVAAATASSLYPQYVKRKDGRSRGSQKGGGVGGASAGKHAATLPAALSSPVASGKAELRRRRGTEPNGNAARAAAGAAAEAAAGQRKVWVAPLTAAALDHERELRASFSQWGVVSAVKVKVEGSRASPGYGFVYFKEEAAVRALLAHIDAGGDPPAFLGRSLLVREAVYKTTPQPSDAPASGPTKPDTASPASSGSSAPALSSLPRLAVGDGVANGGPTAHAANPWEAGVAAGGLPRPHGCADRLPGALPSAVRATPLDDLLDPFVATGGAQPSFDELGSSMLRELLDSPSPPPLPMQQPAPPARVRAASWGDSPAASPWSPPAPFVGGAAAFGHADPLGHPRGQDMATGLPPLGVPSPAGASGTSCSPWWQSGGNLSLGGLPAPALADWGGFGLTSGGAVDDDSKRRVGLGATGSA